MNKVAMPILWLLIVLSSCVEPQTESIQELMPNSVLEMKLDSIKLSKIFLENDVELNENDQFIFEETEELIDGVIKSYLQLGNPRENKRYEVYSSYEDGKKNGIEIWVEDSIVRKIIPYNNNQKNGTEEWFFNDGTIRSQSEYQSGKLNGRVIIYDQQSQIKYLANYKDDFKIGVEKFFYDNSEKLNFEVFYEENKKYKRIEYHQNGTSIKEIQFFKDDWLLHGESKIFYEDGTIRQTITYDNGLIITSVCYSIQGVKEPCDEN